MPKNNQGKWAKTTEEMPPLNKPVKCKLQHWHTKNIQEHDLIRVDEDDCTWRTCDDNSELSYDYNVIGWLKENSDYFYNLMGNIIAIKDRALKVEDLSLETGGESYFQAWIDGFQYDGLTHNEAVENALFFLERESC